MSKTLDNALALPTLGAGTEGQFLRVDADESGYDLAEFYEEATVNLAGLGVFTAGTLKCVRVGNVVTVSNTTDLVHASGPIASTPAGAIPESMRPPLNASNIGTSVPLPELTNALVMMVVTSGGDFSLLYDAANTGVTVSVSVSYCV